MFLRKLGFKISATVAENRASPLSDPGIPLVAAIFPEPTLSAPDLVEPAGHLDAHHIFCVLVAELAFDPQPQGGAMANGEQGIVETVRKNGLRMESVDQIDAFIILSGAVERLLKNVGAMEDNEARRGEKRGLPEHDSQWYALPFADGTPPFDAVMAGDLGPLRQVPQIRSDKSRGLATSPSTRSRQSAKLPSRKAAYSSPSGIVVPFTLKAGDTSLAVNSRASACPSPSSRWTR